MKKKILIALLFFSSFVIADDKLKTIDTTVGIQTDKAKGSLIGKKIDPVIEQIKNKKLDEAELRLKSIQTEFEKIFDKNLKQYSFRSKAEVDEFKQNNKEKFEWIDWGYEQSLQLQAFIYSERKDYKKALETLERTRQIAPLSADLDIETAYTKNMLGMNSEGYQMYSHAAELAKKYPSQKPLLPLALRGMGSSLIELNRLDEAEAIFKESLKIDPNNKTAINELQYISKARSAK